MVFFVLAVRICLQLYALRVTFVFCFAHFINPNHIQKRQQNNTKSSTFTQLTCIKSSQREGKDAETETKEAARTTTTTKQACLFVQHSAKHYPQPLKWRWPWHMEQPPAPHPHPQRIPPNWPCSSPRHWTMRSIRKIDGALSQHLPAIGKPCEPHLMADQCMWAVPVVVEGQWELPATWRGLLPRHPWPAAHAPWPTIRNTKWKLLIR